MENLEILVHSLGPSYDLKKRVFLKKHVSSSYDHENEVICVPQECKLNHVFFSCFLENRILFSSYDRPANSVFFNANGLKRQLFYPTDLIRGP